MNEHNRPEHSPVAARQSTIPTQAEAGEGSISSDSRWRTVSLLFILITTAARLVQLKASLLVPDEAYYWDWSRHHALGYYDQGPFIAYLIRVTVSLFGINEFGVRVGVLFSSLGTILLAYGMARRLFSEMAGFLTVLFLGLSPLMEVGSIIATYDPPLVFFWTLTVVLLERALFAADARTQSRCWYLAGVASGFGFLSKHTMLVVIPCLVLFLILSPQHRRWLGSREPYLAFCITLLMYSGVFWWNAHNHWWTFGHLLFLTHKSGQPTHLFRGVGDFLGSQLLLVGPFLFIGLIAGSSAFKQWLHELVSQSVRIEEEVNPLANRRAGSLYIFYRSEEARESAAIRCALRLYLFCMGWPVFALFLVYAFKARVQGNWAAFAWVTPVILLAAALSEYADRSLQSRRRVAWATAAISACGLALTLVIVFPAIGFSAGIKLKPDADLTNQAVGWIEIAHRVDQVRQEMSAGGVRPVFIAGSGYQYPALLAFYLPDHPYTTDMFLHYRLDMYAAYVDQLKLRLGQDAVFINENKAEEADLRQAFTEVVWDPPLEIYRKPYYDGPIRTVYIARCKGYRYYTGTDLHVGG